MRIVINAYSARLGGGKTYLTNLLAMMPDRPDLEIHLFAHEDLVVADDSRIHRVRARWPVTNPISRAIWERFLLPQYLRQVAADLLFCPGGVLATTPPRGCATATMFRNMLPFDERSLARLGYGLQRLRNAILKPVMLRSMSRADLTIFLADHSRAVIEELVAIPNPVTIPHGVAPSFRTFDRDVPRPESAGRTDYLLYVSRLDVYKHHVEVVRAFAMLPVATRGDLRLLLAGEIDIGEGDAVRSLIGELGLTHQVILLGPVPYAELPALYRHARAILFASSCENCPNILLEALGAGRPLLSSNVMPMPEFGGPDIAYFSPFDPADIARSMSEVLDNPEREARLAQASARRSLLFDWRDTAKRTWEALMATASAAKAVQ